MDYITTYKKIHFTPLNPRQEDILIEDIAHALSLMSRANGHFPTFHSVAQHCIECCEEALARNLGTRISLACLLHDAGEAYLADITRPVKKNLPRYRSIEDNLLDAIWKKYLGGITPEEQQQVKLMDDTLLYYEFYHFMGEELMEKPFITAVPDFPELPFRTVEKRYLELFHDLYGKLNRKTEEKTQTVNGIELICSGDFTPCGHNIRGVLFDMDGLILDTEKLYTRFWQEAAHCLGYPMTKEQALGMRSMNHMEGEARMKSYFGPDTPYREIRSKRIELMDAFVEKEGVYLKPGIHELLDYLKKRGIKTAIATSSPMDRTVKYLSSVHMEKSFDAIVTAYMVEKGKPEPDIYLHAARVLDLEPGDCLALEDSPSGLTAAYRAGCLPVMIPDQDQPSKETRKLLFAKADRLDLIPQLIEEISR
ncbi:MAG: HAD-IA family hydrolase [Lachnospiraceae bacterium]|nr:HAD-IA family hydrolase [Lachnospiraceae bacterium]